MDRVIIYILNCVRNEGEVRPFYKARFYLHLNFASCGSLAPDRSKAVVLLQFD